MHLLGCTNPDREIADGRSCYRTSQLPAALFCSVATRGTGGTTTLELLEEVSSIRCVSVLKKTTGSEAKKHIYIYIYIYSIYKLLFFFQY